MCSLSVLSCIEGLKYLGIGFVHSRFFSIQLFNFETHGINLIVCFQLYVLVLVILQIFRIIPVSCQKETTNEPILILFLFFNEVTQKKKLRCFDILYKIMAVCTTGSYFRVTLQSFFFLNINSVCNSVRYNYFLLNTSEY